jgi:hypothetical protein
VRDTACAGIGPRLSPSDVVREHRGQPAVLYANQRNAGDGLVNEGARRSLVASGLAPKVLTPERAGSHSTVAFLVGAGGSSRPFHHNASLFVPLFQAHRRVYVLPASFDPDCADSNRFLRELPPHVMVF